MKPGGEYWSSLQWIVNNRIVDPRVWTQLGLTSLVQNIIGKTIINS